MTCGYRVRKFKLTRKSDSAGQTRNIGRRQARAMVARQKGK